MIKTIHDHSRKWLQDKLDYLEKGLNWQTNIPERLNEDAYRNHLHAIIGGKKEHYIRGVGRIDILNDYFCIEVKNSNGMMRAIGQAFCYWNAVGRYNVPTVAVFGKEKPKIIEIASYYGILVLQTRQFEPWYIVNKEEVIRSGYE